MEETLESFSQVKLQQQKNSVPQAAVINILLILIYEMTVCNVRRITRINIYEKY